MVQSLANGQIDGFCVGAPWNHLAVESGVGQILHHGPEIVPDCPEKVLAFRADFAARHKEPITALSEAVRLAADWCVDPNHLDELCLILQQAGPTGVNLESLQVILSQAPIRNQKQDHCLLRLDQAATEAKPEHADWIFTQMVAARQIAFSDVAKTEARSVYRADIGKNEISSSVFRD
jgi:NitT/TauT family transport system ATP-binding protein